VTPHAPTSTHRIAIVCPRYGADVGGGAEDLARAIAHLLAGTFDVTVATTCASNYVTWSNHYERGETIDGSVRVLRFPVDFERVQGDFDDITRRAYAEPDSIALAEEWMVKQGPVSTALSDWLRENAGAFRAVIFIPYLYATTAGIRDVGAPSVLVPCLHDEPPLRLAIFDEVLRAPSALSFNTPEEQELAHARFRDLPPLQRVISGPMSRPRLGDARAFRTRYGLDERPYVLCVGRIEEAKGTTWLADRLPEWRDRHPTLDLVLVGREHQALEPRDGLTVTGFVDEETKHDALAGAAVVALPSPYESLSIAGLEAWLQARPTLANAESPVLVGQSQRSGGGLWYSGPAEFHAMLDFLVEYPMVGNVLGAQGRRWAEQETDPTRIRDAWVELIESVASRSAT
jgi:glycosyltransferase involved in cell wall biosynthesis